MTQANDSLPRSTRAALLLALALVAGLRLWGLAASGLPDYDSVQSWQVVRELAQGDLHNLFYHASPGFFLSYVPLAWLSSQTLVLQAVNAGLGVLGLGWFAWWVTRAARLPAVEAAALVLLGGTGLLLTFSGRDFTSGSGSLVLAAGLLGSYYQHLQRPARVGLLRTAGWLAAGLCYNYKFLLMLPILGVLELTWGQGKLGEPGTWWRMLLVLALPYVLLALLGVAAGLPWFRWPAVYYRLVVPKEANAAGRLDTVTLDGLFYLRYLLAFESPLLLLSLPLAFGLVFRDKGWRHSLPALLLVWASCWLLGMSLLIKAPRGLLFAYLPLAALAVLSLRALLPRWAALSALALAIGLNLGRLLPAFYQAPPSAYPAVAQWLRAHHARAVASTVGVGLAPYLGDSVRFTIITDERQLPALRRQGYDYVLLDGYWRVAGVRHFDSLRTQRPAASWREPRLSASALLFLEHAEYTGRSYRQTLTEQQAAARDTPELRLFYLGSH